MIKTLTSVGNSKAVIIPKKLIRKYNLTEVTIIEVKDGILITPATKEPSYQDRLDELRHNKNTIYTQMKKEASEPDMQHYYENNVLPEIDIDLIEE